MKKTSILFLITMLLIALALPLAAQTHPAKSKKIKLSKLTVKRVGDSYSLFDLVPFVGTENQASPAFLPEPFGFMFYYEDYDYLAGGKFRINTRVSFYGASGMHYGDSPVETGLRTTVYDSRIVLNPYLGEFGFFKASANKKGNGLDYTFQRSDQLGNPVGDEVVIDKIKAPAAMHGGNTYLTGTGLQARPTMTGYTGAFAGYVFESGGAYEGVDSSFARAFNININSHVETSTSEVKLEKGGEYQRIRLEDFTYDSGTSTALFSSDGYRYQQGSVYPYSDVNRIYMSYFFTNAGMSTAVKTRTIASSQPAETTTLGYAKYMMPEDGAQTGYVFYNSQKFPAAKSTDFYDSSYRMQALNKKFRKSGAAAATSFPAWSHKIAKNPLPWFPKYDDQTSNLVRVAPNMYIGLLYRNLTIPSQNVGTPAGSKISESQVLVVLLDAETNKLSEVGFLKTRVKDGDFYYNPRVALSGDTLAFYIEKANTTTWNPTAYYAIVPVKDFIGQ